MILMSTKLFDFLILYKLVILLKVQVCCKIQTQINFPLHLTVGTVTTSSTYRWA